MANRTDVLAKTIHGTNPQNLIEKIIRQRAYNSLYWKEQCFGLDAEKLVDRAIELEYLGGIYGGLRKPTKFLCLVLKMLQIQPDKDIIVTFIKNEDYKYVRMLGAFYMRLVGRHVDIYQYLEPLLNDYRRIRYRENSGKFHLTHVDEFVQDLLEKDMVCDIVLPQLMSRVQMEAADWLKPRV
eukprot:gene2739-3376_t